MKTGFIGLGAMGRSMASNLARAGQLHAVWNRSVDKAQTLATELGCTVASSAAELAGQCDCLVICVSADDDLREVVGSMRANLRPGSLLIDCSTVAASTAREIAATLASQEVDFLDCPVSGGVEGARLGTLAIMCGGPENAFSRAQPVLQAMGKTIRHFGASGAGQSVKATNQILCAGIIRTVAEAMAFAKAEQLPLEPVIETLGQGAGSSWYFVNRAPWMAKDSFTGGFKVRLHAKDLRICREMAAAHGVALPVIEDTLRDYQELIEQGHGDDDISAIFRLKRFS
jgi:3-hydroxyisobutyrate dehydrogenase